MEIVLVHWLIRKGRELDFEKHWQQMTIEQNIGLFREVLTTPDKNTFDPKFQIFTLENPNPKTNINIGFGIHLNILTRQLKSIFQILQLNIKTEKLFRQLKLKISSLNCEKE